MSCSSWIFNPFVSGRRCFQIPDFLQRWTNITLLSKGLTEHINPTLTNPHFDFMPSKSIACITDGSLALKQSKVHSREWFGSVLSWGLNVETQPRDLTMRWNAQPKGIPRKYFNCTLPNAALQRFLFAMLVPLLTFGPSQSLYISPDLWHLCSKGEDQRG